MNEYAKIQQERCDANREFDRRIRELQDACRHAELTTWLTGYYADARLCKRCMKSVETKPSSMLRC